MNSKSDKLLLGLMITFLVVFIVSFTIIALMTNGIRINRKLNRTENGLKFVEYEQVYHVFIPQEIFLTVTNTSDKTIGIVRIKGNEKEDKLLKLQPGQTKKLYYNLDSYFEDVTFNIEEIRFVGD